MMGASKIIGVDKNVMKREKGEVFGLTHFINPSDSNKSASELVKEVNGGIGVDYSFECTGVPSLLNVSIDATKLVSSTSSKNSVIWLIVFLNFGSIYREQVKQ